MLAILGILMWALWIWSVVIVVRKLENTTTLEKVVLYVGLGTLILFIIGALMG